MLTPDQILIVIDKLPIKEALTYLVINQVFGFSKKGYDKVKKAIKDKYNHDKYSFVPDKKQAIILEELEDHPDYQTVLSIIPNYRYIDVIRTGLLIRSYHENPSNDNQQFEKKIKTQINKRPNGKTLLNIIRLATTPYFALVINNLYQLKRSGYSQQQLLDEFDETIIEWDDSYLPVKSNTTYNTIIKFCRYQINRKNKKFFLLGIKTAGKNIEIAIDKLKEIKYFINNNYKVSINKEEHGVEPRVEATIRKIIE